VSGEIDEENKRVTRIVDDAFGGNSRISSYPELDERRRIKVLSRPQRNDLISFCTIGLSDLQPPTDIQPPLGVEILAVSERQEFPKVLVATGLYAIEDGWLLSPGTIVLGVVAEHLGEPLLPHLLLLEPFLWENEEFSSANYPARLLPGCWVFR